MSKIAIRMTVEITIGSVAVATMTTRSCFTGEIGVCYGFSRFEGRPVYGFIFETGRFIVLTTERLEQTLRLTGRVCEEVADYSYAGDAQLKTDFREGFFKRVFSS